MVALPEEQHTTLKLVERATEEAQATNGGGRAHLGASLIGDECQRKLWFIFRWAAQTKHPARLLRLFNRGAREEEVFNFLLRQAGLNVWDVDPDTNQQWRVEAVGGHFGGSLDGVVQGLVEAPKAPHVSEQKTHNDKSFKNVRSKGVQESKPEHYAQMQVYMHLMNIDRALYQAVNKNDDELYFERVKYDKQTAEGLLAKAERIITSDLPPEGISHDPAFYKCKWCDQSNVCHGNQVPQANCRTCCFSTPETDGDARWSCSKHGKDLNQEDQRLGCDQHLFIPALLTNWAECIDGDDDAVRYRNKSTGAEFVNGEGGFTSKEMAKVIDVSVLGDPIVDTLKQEFGAEVVG